MNVRYQKHIPNDVASIQEYYAEKGDESLADEFLMELKRVIRDAAQNPGRFPLLNEKLRRANLKRFPYHILYQVRPGCLYVMIVRHHKRQPSFGLKRR